MPHLLNLENATLTVPERPLLDAVSLGLDDGDRVGVVGRNGGGKSTLLRVLAGRQELDAGRATRTRGVAVAMLDQVDTLDGALSVLRAVVGDAAEHAWASVPRVREVMGGLLDGLDPGALVGSLSGGQRRRVALAALLVGDVDLLLLDEPTNHLDVEGVAWLATHLRSRWPAGRGGLVVVTHDRWFLDEVCTRTWEVVDGSVEAYEGGYAAYVLARAERARVGAVMSERRANLLRKELAWLRRGAPARTSKPKFRVDAATALIADEPAPRDTVTLTRTASARLGKDVVDVEDVSLSRGGRVLLDRVTWRLGPGERVGLVGVNGSGKTSLLHLLTGVVRPDAGRVRRGTTVRAALLSQEVLELDALADLRVIESVEREAAAVAVGGREVTAGQLVERLGFSRARAWTRVGDLSGGERRRLQLLRLLVGEPNLLLLDEPTNDLDTDVLTEVEDLLDGWPGTLVVVSHDRYLLERVTDRQVALLGDGALRDLPGGVDQYLSLRAAAPTQMPAPSPRDLALPRDLAVPVAFPVSVAGEVRAARKQMSRLERRIARLTGEEERLHAEMARRATEHEAVVELDGALRAVHAERETLEHEWLEAAETADGPADG